MAHHHGHLPERILARAREQRLRHPAKADRDPERDGARDQEEEAPAEHVRGESGAKGPSRRPQRDEDQHVGDRLLPHFEGEAIRQVDQRCRKDAAGDAAGDEAGDEQGREVGRQCGERVGNGRPNQGDADHTHSSESISQYAVKSWHQAIGEVVETRHPGDRHQRYVEARRDRDEQRCHREAIGHGGERAEIQKSRYVPPRGRQRLSPQPAASRTPTSSRCTNRSRGSS